MTPSVGLSRRDLLGSLAACVLQAVPVAVHGATALQRQDFLFGSPVEVLLSRRCDAAAEAAVDEVLAGLRRMHVRWNAWKPGELGALNDAIRDGRSAAATPELLALIRGATLLERQSGGLFNIGIGGAVRAWGFHDDVMRDGTRPRAGELQPWRRARPSLAQLEIRGLQVRSSNPWLQLDLGAYAKGVAIDWALDRLRARGIDDAVVNLGGNLAAMGGGADEPWRIGIRDPAGEGLLASLQTSGREAVVTSGSYERFRTLDGERFTHILDPGTAAPASELVSATVVHACAGRADAAATALLVAGRQRWRKVALQMGVSEAMIVDRHLRGEVTPQLARRLQFANAQWRAAVVVA